MAKFLIVKENDERLVDETRWKFYESKGYRKVDEVLAERKKSAKKSDAGADEKELSKMNKAELSEKVASMNIEVPANATNKEIVALIEAASKADENQ